MINHYFYQGKNAEGSVTTNSIKIYFLIQVGIFFTVSDGVVLLDMGLKFVYNLVRYYQKNLHFLFDLDY
jgi:hypothetical protein